MRAIEARLVKLEDLHNDSKRVIVLFCKDERAEAREYGYPIYKERPLPQFEDDRRRETRLKEEAIQEYKDNNTTFTGQHIVAMTHRDAACL